MEVIHLGAKSLVVLHGCCPGRAHELALELQRQGFRVFEAEFSSCLYWDGTCSYIISPTPLAVDTKSAVIVSKEAYVRSAAEGARLIMNLVELAESQRKG